MFIIHFKEEDDDTDEIKLAHNEETIPLSSEAQEELQMIQKLMVQEALVFGSTTAIKKAVIHCGCKSKGCKSAPCSCKVANIHCSSFCACSESKTCFNRLPAASTPDQPTVAPVPPTDSDKPVKRNSKMTVSSIPDIVLHTLIHVLFSN